MKRVTDWHPPESWSELRTVDAHTEGEPFRVIVSGLPEIPGQTILERRRYASERLDTLRRCLMWEPRGHADMYGGILTPAESPDADMGVLFIHNDGFSTMCGHGIIALTTVVLEMGMLPLEEPQTTLRIDSPAGLVTAHARTERGRVRSVYFHNVPSFVSALNQTVELPDLGCIRYDLAFGGAFYAYVDAASVGLSLTARDYRRLIDYGVKIKRAVAATHPIRHPTEDDLGFLYGVVFTGPAQEPGAHSRNVCIFANGELDRSPTGTSVSARLALLHARGELAAGQTVAFESILGTRFQGNVVRQVTFGEYDAVIPEVEGSAYITGIHRFVIDPDDPLRDGFLLR